MTSKQDSNVVYFFCQALEHGKQTGMASSISTDIKLGTAGLGRTQEFEN